MEVYFIMMWNFMWKQGFSLEVAAIYFLCGISRKSRFTFIRSFMYMQAQLAKTAKRKCLYLSMIWIHSLSLRLIPYKRENEEGEKKGEKKYSWKGKATDLSVWKGIFIAITKKRIKSHLYKEFPYKCFSFAVASSSPLLLSIALIRNRLKSSSSLEATI